MSFADPIGLKGMNANTTTDRTRWAALYVLCAGMLMIVLDATIVNVALPSIQDDLGFSQSNLAWVVNAYLIAFGGLLLLAGRAGDLLGQRRVFLVGLAIFTVASVLCATAQTQGMLIVARFVQGVGGALTSAVVLGMIVTMFPEPREQAKALGVYGFVASAGGSIGLLAGGVLTDAINWHWIFFINAPIGVLTMVLALRWIEARPGLGVKQGADLPGAVLLTAGLMLGVYTILGVIEYGWTSQRTLSLAGISAVLLVAFVVRQAMIDNPLMPLRLFRSRNVTGANIVMALVVVGMFGLFFLGALYLQRILGYSPLEVGLAFLPSTVVMGIVSLRFAEPLSTRFGPRTTLIPALAMTAVGLLLFARAPVDGTYVIDVMPVDGPARPRHGPLDARADDPVDVGLLADGRRPRLGPREHDRAGRRRDRPRRAGDAGQRAHRRVADRRGAELRLPPRVRDRRDPDGRVRRRRCRRPAPAARSRATRTRRRTPSRSTRSAGVLRVRDVSSPHGVGPVVRDLLHRQVRHERRRSGAVPVDLVGLEEHGVTGADGLDRAALGLGEPGAFGHVDRLPERVRVPGRARAGREVHAQQPHVRAGRDRVDPGVAGEPLRGGVAAAGAL